MPTEPTQTNTPSPSSPASEPRMTMTILMSALSIYIVLTMTVLDGNIVNVALPTMSKQFGVTRAATVWVVNAYQLIITMLLLPLASLADVKGYKKIFLTGVLVFTLGSAACALSRSFLVLLASRVLEGIGAAAIMSVNIALIRIVYPPKFLSKGLSYNAIIVGGATAVGPTLAGAILSIASWHWLFIINIPLGILALWIGKKHLPCWSPAKVGVKERFDIVSAIESAIIFGLFINLMEGFSRAPTHWLVWTQSALIVVLSIFFIRRQLKQPYPMFPLDLFKNRAFSLAIFSSMGNFMATMLAMVSLPFFLKEDLGYNVLHVGLLISPWPIALIVASYLSGFLASRYNISWLSAIGMAIAAVGLWLLYIEPNDGGFWDIAWRMMVCGFGFGLFKTPNNVLQIHSSPITRSGAASGIKSTSRLFGQCVGTAMVAIVFHHATLAFGSRLCLLLGVVCAVVAMVLCLAAVKRVENRTQL